MYKKAPRSLTATRRPPRGIQAAATRSYSYSTIFNTIDVTHKNHKSHSRNIDNITIET